MTTTDCGCGGACETCKAKDAASAVERARKVDLVTLPNDIPGTCCDNCRFVASGKDWCDHPDVAQALPSGRKHMCCDLWDRPGVERAWTGGNVAAKKLTATDALPANLVRWNWTPDRAYFADDMSSRISRTPEGFLICRDVPIARVGIQLYGPGETPVDVGPDGVVYVDRPEEEVFAPEAVASFEGKDVVDDHPDDPRGIVPDNWRNLAVGHGQNVRRGKGADSDYLFADFLIKDPSAIDAVIAGKREISCGYDSEYEQTGPGRARQYNIRGNHFALVQKGRCGPRCAIRDHAVAPPRQVKRRRAVRVAIHNHL